MRNQRLSQHSIFYKTIIISEIRDEHTNILLLHRIQICQNEELCFIKIFGVLGYVALSKRTANLIFV